MIWAKLQDGMIATSYSPEMIELPESLQAIHKGNKSGDGRDPAAATNRSPACKKRHKTHKPPSQHAITPSRLGKNIMVARNAAEVPDSASSRPVSRPSPSPSPSRWGHRPQDMEGALQESTWWSCSAAGGRGNVGSGSRPMPDRPSTSEGAARNRYTLSTPAPANRPSTSLPIMERGNLRSSSRFGNEAPPHSARQQRQRLLALSPSPGFPQGGGGSCSSKAAVPPAPAAGNDTAFLDDEKVVLLQPEMLSQATPAKTKGLTILTLDRGPPSSKADKGEQSSRATTPRTSPSSARKPGSPTKQMLSRQLAMGHTLEKGNSKSSQLLARIRGNMNKQSNEQSAGNQTEFAKGQLSASGDEGLSQSAEEMDKEPTDAMKKIMAKTLVALTGDKSILLKGDRESAATTAGAAKIFNALHHAQDHSSPTSSLKPKSKLAATLERLSAPHTMERLKAQALALVRPGPGHATRSEAAPAEIPKMLTQTIKRVVCGESEADDSERRVPADRQLTYEADELRVDQNGKPVRDLNSGEREKIAAVFKEMAKNSTAVAERPGEKGQEGKDAKQELAEEALRSVSAGQTGGLVAWSEIAKRLRGRLSSAHIQRLSVYLGLKGRVRIGVYIERVGLLLTATPEKRLRIAFNLLDVGGDSVIGRRDIFAALSATRVEENKSDEELEAVFLSPGPFGIDFADSDTSALEVIGVVTASPAEQQGVRPGARLSHVNGLSIEDFTVSEVRTFLSSPARPFSLGFRMKPDMSEQNFGGINGMVEMSDFNKLLRALGSDKTTKRVKVMVLSARNLRNADVHAGKSDPYCLVEVLTEPPRPAKPYARWQTKVVNDCLDPEWKEEREIADYQIGEVLKFTVKDKDVGPRGDEVLGFVKLQGKNLEELNRTGLFEGELPLRDDRMEKNDEKKGATLRVRVQLAGEGGIGLHDFLEVFEDSEPAFLAPLQEALAGIPRKSKNDQSPVEAVKVRVTMIKAAGLRNADMGGKSDPYCTCEIAGRTRYQRLQTKVIHDTLDPNWNEWRVIHDYYPGEALRFAVYDSDPGKSQASDDLLGQVTLSSVQFWPSGFEGELQLLDGGRNFTPTLKVKVSTPQSMVPAEKAKAAQEPVPPAVSIAMAESRREAFSKHESQIAELKARLPHLPGDVFDWHTRVFEALCDDDYLIRRPHFISESIRLFGVPVGRIAGRFFDVMSSKAQLIGVREWGQIMERYRGDDYDTRMERVSLAFLLYDLDGDGYIDVQDGVDLSMEVDRLTMMGDECASEPVCEEMRWLYGLVANTTSASGSDAKLDLHLFKQLRPQPAITQELMKNLDKMAEQPKRDT
eukprot:TRINITY_DN20498_c0_g1_i1.p1 TRINITY_DN20498_c0_g1~~TRINITY_DN20498_c0_g1_i1.p1  ORF type:complete len:1320 (+),score=255.60 TRINITY_DN20498_c0_g1_i1:391-4350(+)